MDNLHKRYLLFLIGCMGTRLAFALVAKHIPTNYLPYLGTLALIPVIGWLYIIFVGRRDTGAEVFGEKIWWKDIRIIHTLLYASFAYLAFRKDRRAWLVLLADVLFGFTAFIIHHFVIGESN
jgi:hypothetical protein